MVLFFMEPWGLSLRPVKKKQQPEVLFNPGPGEELGSRPMACKLWMKKELYICRLSVLVCLGRAEFSLLSWGNYYLEPCFTLKAVQVKINDIFTLNI